VSQRRPPFGPVRLSEEQFASLFEELEPKYRDKDGRKLRRVRNKITGAIGVEDPMDELFHIEVVEPKPMEAPKGGIFYMESEFPEPLKKR
jgi:hypothetical protein